MFLDRLLETNAALAELALSWTADGTILPDTYLIDLDMIEQNARALKAAADARNIALYFMLKQFGRNPLVGKRLAELGYEGAVCVDYREALTLLEAGVPIAHVGHLVQTPHAALGRILEARPRIITVYSLEKAAEIGAEASAQGFIQPIMLRVLGPDDVLYPGQYGGFSLEELPQTIGELEKTKGIRIAGACSFPCMLFSAETHEVEPLPNAHTVRAAAEQLRKRGYDNLELNMPSNSCVHTVGLVSSLGGTHMEPGHGLSGTTPYHAAHSTAAEGVGYVYASEVSHNLGGHAYCYGGGHYRRGHVAAALVGRSLDTARRAQVITPADESIDYYFELSDEAKVGDPVLMCFRTQMFVTRSHVAVVSGLSQGAPRLEGLFDTHGRRIA